MDSTRKPDIRLAGLAANDITSATMPGSGSARSALGVQGRLRQQLERFVLRGRRSQAFGLMAGVTLLAGGSMLHSSAVPSALLKEGQGNNGGKGLGSNIAAAAALGGLDGFGLADPSHMVSPALLPPTAPDPVAPLLRGIEDPNEQMTLRAQIEGDEAARETGLPAWPAEDVTPPGAPRLPAKAWYVVDNDSGEVLWSRNADKAFPIASITKLMGMMIYADSAPDLDEVLTLTQDDKDYLQVTRSRLRVGYQYRAGDLLFHSLLPSDNRATIALMRQTQLSPDLFREAMNRRAEVLGLTRSHFDEPTGLSPDNMASARDVALLLEAALLHPTISKIIREKEHYYLRADAPVMLGARSSNRLSHLEDWHVIASKTGFTYAAGSCLTQKMVTDAGRTLTMVILGASGEKGRYPVAASIRSFLENKDIQIAMGGAPDSDE